jgi:hypothetical protein
MSKPNKEPEKQWRLLELDDVKEDDPHIDLQDDYEQDENSEESEV